MISISENRKPGEKSDWQTFFDLLKGDSSIKEAELNTLYGPL